MTNIVDANLLQLCTADSLHLINIIKQFGEDARFVGGCVRDSLLGIPYHDVDIATTLDINILMQTIREHHNNINNAINNKINHILLDNVFVYPTGIEHGTITIRVNNSIFQLTTLRKDVSCDGRRATVNFTKRWEEDAARRDFTINALYADIDGRVYDYFNGIYDLQNRMIRFIGDPAQRLKEDYLRVLRYFRFYGRFTLCKIKNEHTFNHIANKVMNNNIINNVAIRNEIHEYNLHIISLLAVNMNILSRERIREELLGILQNDSWKDIITIMHNNNILKYCRIQNVTLTNIAYIPNDIITDAVDRLSCIITTTEIKEICNQLKMSKQQYNRITWLHQYHDALTYSEPHDIDISLLYYGDHTKIVVDVIRYNPNMIEYTINIKTKYNNSFFPIKTIDILGKIPNNLIAYTIKTMKLLWAKSLGKLTKEQLIDKVINKRIDPMI